MKGRRTIIMGCGCKKVIYPDGYEEITKCEPWLRKNHFERPPK
jgi:hypothetical protein